MGGVVCLKTIAGRKAWPATDCVYVAFNSNLVRVAILLVPQRVPWDVAFR
jgi:hypothetical protein